jgi:glycosyltransferase involved in cell wall biosynthesis
MEQSPTTRVVAGRFSIVVPSFQQGGFLERTLQSILGQREVDVEVIVQDGGSTDQTVGILKRYGDRVRWESRTDGGQAAAINSGLQRATGEYIGYLNSDDVLYEGALQQVRAFFTAHPTAGVVYGLADFIDENDQAIAAYPVEPWSYVRLREICFICQPACFYRRSVWERCGPFDPALHYSMDYEYWLRVGAVEPFHFLPQKLAGSRHHGSAKTFNRSREAHRETIAVLRRYHAGRIPPFWIIAYARHCGEHRLREGGPLPLRWLKFAISYWIHLLMLAPKVTPGGARVLLRKLGPPYPTACRRIRDPLSCLNMGPVSKRIT